MRVSVHRNLHWGSGLGFSILDSKMRVIKRNMYVIVKAAEFVVQPAGKQRAIETGVRNVHAFVRGNLFYAEDIAPNIPGGLVKVSYNPTVAGHFYTTDDHREIYSADTVWLHNGAAWVV